MNINITTDDFDLSKHLENIPIEELKCQYEVFSHLTDLNGFDIITQIDDISDTGSNVIKASTAIKQKLGLKDWQVLIHQTCNHVDVIIIFAGIFKNTKTIITEMNSLGFIDCKSWHKLKKLMLWKAIKFEPKMVIAW